MCYQVCLDVELFKPSTGVDDSRLWTTSMRAAVYVTKAARTWRVAGNQSHCSQQTDEHIIETTMSCAEDVKRAHRAEMHGGEGAAATRINTGAREQRRASPFVHNPSSTALLASQTTVQMPHRRAAPPPRSVSPIDLNMSSPTMQSGTQSGGVPQGGPLHSTPPSRTYAQVASSPPTSPRMAAMQVHAPGPPGLTGVNGSVLTVRAALLSDGRLA